MSTDKREKKRKEERRREEFLDVKNQIHADWERIVNSSINKCERNREIENKKEVESVIVEGSEEDREKHGERE